MKKDLLDRLIEDRLILQEAKKNDLKIDENRVRAKMDEIKRGYKQDSEFQDALAKQGLVQADVELRIREQLLMYNIVDAKVRGRIIVNPGEVTDFYNKNIEDFKLTETRELEAISIQDKNTASEISDNLKNGQALPDLIKKYSLSVNKLSATKKGQLRQDIENVVFKLKQGEISGPVKIQDTYYIFKLDNIVPGRLQTLSEAQDKIYAFLFDKKIQEELTKWLDELKIHAYIKIFSEN
jgi:parvulin-like peptidyl-prolyl isomerase